MLRVGTHFWTFWVQSGARQRALTQSVTQGISTLEREKRQVCRRARIMPRLRVVMPPRNILHDNSLPLSPQRHTSPALCGSSRNGLPSLWSLSCCMQKIRIAFISLLQAMSSRS
ncbi:hypothetical protein B0A91_03660 [Pseudomonas syringae]|nr:hypothetical protein B1F67_03570 [Pseudomonas syringae]RXU05181.1 hypothetical protein B1F68_16970 [Pseudomonas syringae]RXU11308.1 hypothetical protein B1F70_19260 [Pseudomonas syringae]RXU17858.1 hypothetical protein BXU05_01005 [Pseudomonas syringae]RXU27143.1 hypothetical protein B0A91_03660 [Pseudomonas syringae]